MTINTNRISPELKAALVRVLAGMNLRDSDGIRRVFREHVRDTGVTLSEFRALITGSKPAIRQERDRIARRARIAAADAAACAPISPSRSQRTYWARPEPSLLQGLDRRCWRGLDEGPPADPRIPAVERPDNAVLLFKDLQEEASRVRAEVSAFFSGNPTSEFYPLRAGKWQPQQDLNLLPRANPATGFANHSNNPEVAAVLIGPFARQDYDRLIFAVGRDGPERFLGLKGLTPECLADGILRPGDRVFVGLPGDLQLKEIRENDILLGRFSVYEARLQRSVELFMVPDMPFV